MKKQLIFTLSCLFVWSTWAIAESNLVDLPQAELLIEDQPTSTSTQQMDQTTIVGQPVEIVVDENGQSEVIQEQAVEYRRIESNDGTEVYEALPVQSVTPEVAVSESVEVQTNSDLEVIELESYDEDVITVEAQETISVQEISTTKGVHSFCQQNPLAKQCLYSKYLSLCKKDPQSAHCLSELEKFEKFCTTFPRAYKCKKAQLAATCKQQPQLNECKTMGQRYCQKYPKAVFCNWN